MIAALCVIVVIVIQGCGDPPPTVEKKTAIVEPTRDLKEEITEVRALKKETDCIRIFLSDMKQQQQVPINGWEQPPYGEYENGDCKQTMRPLQ